MSDAVPCMWMRGGTSKGGYFLAEQLPKNRDEFLLRVMGSPDPRQIDGIGGADSLTSKVAVVSKSHRQGIDVDYLFLQVAVDEPIVFDMQNCGNILAGVGPFAIERGLVDAPCALTEVSIYMENTGQIAIARVPTVNGLPTYDGNAAIDGVPGTAAAISLEFKDTAGSSCGALLPTGNVRDSIDDVPVTMIDNGMPVVVLRATDLGLTGLEDRNALDTHSTLKTRLEAIRLICGPLMNLGDVTEKSVPKMTLISPPTNAGAISTRTFIPHRCHASIGVLGAVSVTTACLLPGSIAADMAQIPEGNIKHMLIEHPIGVTAIEVRMNSDGSMASAASIRTARKLFDGDVFA